MSYALQDVPHIRSGNETWWIRYILCGYDAPVKLLIALLLLDLQSLVFSTPTRIDYRMFSANGAVPCLTAVDHMFELMESSLWTTVRSTAMFETLFLMRVDYAAPADRFHGGIHSSTFRSLMALLALRIFSIRNPSLIVSRRSRCELYYSYVDGKKTITFNQKQYHPVSSTLKHLELDLYLVKECSSLVLNGIRGIRIIQVVSQHDGIWRAHDMVLLRSGAPLGSTTLKVISGSNGPGPFGSTPKIRF